jgi:dihydroneopterin aldolase
MPTGLLTIKLENLRFYSYHGLYPEERRLGGEYRVDVEVDHRSSDPASVFDIATGQSTPNSAPSTPITDLSHTIDYALLFAIVKEEMDRPRDLLETLAMCIADKIATAYPCQRIAVEIKKYTVPINDFSGNTAVRYEWKN